MKKEVILRTKGLFKTFIATKAVDNISFEMVKGEVRGLIGENGSGKSTLASMISGILKPDKGEMFFNGGDYSPKDQVDANNSGISIIVQEMSTIEGLTVAENIFLGNEAGFINRGIINKRKMNNEATKLLEKHKVSNIGANIDVELLSFEERKMIELVKSVYFNPKIFIVDETTTALSRKGRGKLFEIINDLKNKGSSILFITHDLEELIEICDTVTILRDGKVVDTIENKDLSEHILKNMMVGRETEGKYYRDDYIEFSKTKPVLEVRDIGIPGILKNINFDLYKGEILGIGGLTNSGMHTLGRVAFGAEKAESGHIKLVKTGKIIKNIREAIANGIGYVSKNRDQEGLMLMANIKDNISLPSLYTLGRLFFINLRKERNFAIEGAKRLDVKMSSIEQLTLFLSGGNKQRVALTKWLSKDSDILVLDCPTRGIDVMVKASIYDLIRELKENGKSIIMISEEILELIGMCDRIIVLKKGEVTSEFKRDRDLSEETIIKHMI